ncbi:UNVERIFIED_CONTAM: 4-hydroxyphenylpyruvate dioxygenase [Sesamum radiatum]|uniref:4-hydroxyphenylpyruvate dioxygenase n=1 Tax=Sesamum radiatum TaxID=300843 RepID=A0AAW2RFJ1_SESRA
MSSSIFSLTYLLSSTTLHHHHKHRRFRHRIATLPLKTKATMDKEPITTTATATSAASAAAESAAAHAEFKLVGFKNFIRTNPKSDHFPVHRFHHVEFWCGDAINTAKRFSWGLGMPLVESAFSAYSASVSRGAKPISPPILLSDNKTAIAEVHLYGDSVLRFVSCGDDGTGFLPGFEPVDNEMSYQELDYGIRRLDHAVGNVPELGPVVNYLKKFTGFHEFAEFTAEDVGTAESGLNSVVLANNNENVLFPLNEPVYGTKRKSQIQTYLEHNEGSGVQHLALVSEDIFRTLREMRKRSGVGGFEFMPSPPPTYYKNLKSRARDVLTDEQIEECEKLGILVDRDDQGTLLQIFTKPVGDRPTIFIEIIQRIGCMLKDEEGKLYQKGGCGGFGKGNFSELFKSIEEYEKMLEAKRVTETATT